MEINLNLVLFEELKDKPEGRTETRIVIIRQSADVDSPLEDGAAGLQFPD